MIIPPEQIVLAGWLVILVIMGCYKSSRSFGFKRRNLRPPEEEYVEKLNAQATVRTDWPTHHPGLLYLPKNVKIVPNVEGFTQQIQKSLISTEEFKRKLEKK